MVQLDNSTTSFMQPNLEQEAPNLRTEPKKSPLAYFKSQTYHEWSNIMSLVKLTSPTDMFCSENYLDESQAV